MLIDRSREKLINAILYFVENTRNCGKTKLFKLLYLLDFEHYRQIGRSVTGLTYHAWEKGPVPPALDEEIEEPKEDLRERIDITCNPRGYQNTYPTWEIVSKGTLVADYFSQRELGIMEELAKLYRNTTANALIDITHKMPPWKRTWEEEGRYFGEISYDLALSGEEAEMVRELAVEHEEMVRSFS